MAPRRRANTEGWSPTSRFDVRARQATRLHAHMWLRCATSTRDEMTSAPDPYCRLNFICGLCNRILTDPQQTNCCGSHFCRTCIDDKCAGGETSCPECNSEKVSYFQDIHFGRRINGCEPRTQHIENSHVCDQVHHDKQKDGPLSEAKPAKCQFSDVGCTANLSTDEMRTHMKEASDKHLMLVFSGLSSKLSELHTSIYERHEKIEQKLDAQEKMLESLCGKVKALENRVSSHALLPYSVIVPNIDHYIEGSIGDEWKSPKFYTGTHSDKRYRLQLSVVPHSIHKRNKEAALSARLLITSGEADQTLTWPFHAMFILVFIDPSGTEKPYEVVGRYTWASPSDESSLQFKACITHKDLLKYVQDDNKLHLCIHDHH